VDVNTLRSPDANLTKEAERVVKMMPKWKPARQKGKAVRSQYNLPVQFSIPKDK
jgi:protein TonB